MEELDRAHVLIARRFARSEPRERMPLVCIAGSRWRVEDCFRQAKNEVGLDHYQVGSYRTW